MKAWYVSLCVSLYLSTHTHIYKCTLLRLSYVIKIILLSHFNPYLILTSWAVAKTKKTPMHC